MYHLRGDQSSTWRKTCDNLADNLAVGLAEAVIGAGITGYLSLCKSDHSEGGITFEAAKSKNFIDDCGEDSPRI